MFRRSHKNFIQAPEPTPISVMYQGKALNLIRIKEKLDGKNTSDYDGTYVLHEIYITQDKKRDVHSYQPGQIFFLKMFPRDPKMFVEGFCEALLGKIIAKMIEQAFIDPFYSDCFSPAEAINIPEVGLALLQPFVIGAVPFFQVSNQTQTKKRVVKEVMSRFLGQGYEKHLGVMPQAPHGLSYIIMIMVLLGNYSLHSGNIMVTLTDEQANFTVIDYGAGLRNFMGTLQQTDIWQSLEEQVLPAVAWTFKKYLEFYKKIPGLFTAVVEHAANFLAGLREPERLREFHTLILEAVGSTYDVYRSAIKKRDEGYWKTAKTELLKYIYGNVEYPKVMKRIRSYNAEKSPGYIRPNDVNIGQLRSLLPIEGFAIDKGKVEKTYLCYDILEIIFHRLLTMNSITALHRIPSNSRITKYASVMSPRSSKTVSSWSSESKSEPASVENNFTDVEEASAAVEAIAAEETLSRHAPTFFLEVAEENTLADYYSAQNAVEEGEAVQVKQEISTYNFGQFVRAVYKEYLEYSEARHAAIPRAICRNRIPGQR